MLKEIGLLLRKELLLESRQKHSFNSLILYLVSTVFVCKLCFRSVPEPGSWNALFWIIMLFSAISAAGKSFAHDSKSRFIYLYWIASPQAVIIAKVIYNIILMLFLTGIGFLVYILLLGNNPVQNMPLFILNAFLGSFGFSAILTTMSAISSRTNNSFTLMAVLSFPIILPLLMTVIRISKNAIDGLDTSVSYKYLLVLAGINVITWISAISYFRTFGRIKATMNIKKNWWKFLTILLLLYTVIMGFLGTVPARDILNETIRNLYFHVPMWFGMMTLLFISVIYGINYLNTGKPDHDIIAKEAAHTGVTMGILGLITGSLWARYTWGTWWTPDTKLNGAAITMLIYFAYFILRGSVEDEQKKARLSAVYSIFAFVMMIVFILILPRMEDSLHPGNGGNPGFSKYDLDSRMRMVFYPAVLGWILLGVWILNVRIRLARIETELMNEYQE